MRYILVLIMTLLASPLVLAQASMRIYNTSRVCSDGSKPKDNLIDDAISLKNPIDSSDGEIAVVFHNDAGEVCIRDVGARFSGNQMQFYANSLFSDTSCVYSGSPGLFNQNLFTSGSYQAQLKDGVISVQIPAGSSGNHCAPGKSLTVTFTPVAAAAN